MPAGKRSVRVGEQLLKEIAYLVEHKVRDPRVRKVTLTGVHMTSDLKIARVYYSLFGDEKEIEQAGDGLESAKGFIKREIGRTLSLRYMPDLQFRHDPSLARGEEMDRLIESLNLPEEKEGERED